MPPLIWKVTLAGSSGFTSALLGKVILVVSPHAGVAQIQRLQKDEQWQVLVRQAGHLAAKRSVGLLVVERRFRGGHSVAQAAMGKVGNRFDDQLVGTRDQFLKNFQLFHED